MIILVNVSILAFSDRIVRRLEFDQASPKLAGANMELSTKNPAPWIPSLLKVDDLVYRLAHSSRPDCSMSPSKTYALNDFIALEFAKNCHVSQPSCLPNIHRRSRIAEVSHPYNSALDLRYAS